MCSCIRSSIIYLLVLTHNPISRVQQCKVITSIRCFNINMYMLSGCELIDTENISLPSQNMKLGGESNRLIFFSINHIHIQMTCLSSLNQT